MGWDKFEKLVELIKRRISQIVLHRLNDPRIGFLTITRIKLARDLETCEVFYSVYGSEGDISKTTHALRQARGYIQREVAKTLRTRIMPKIVFRPEEALEGVNRINKIFDEINAEREDAIEKDSDINGIEDGDEILEGGSEKTDSDNDLDS